MKNKLLYFATFAAGAVVGAAATYQYFKTKYEEMAKEDFNSRRSEAENLKGEGVDADGRIVGVDLSEVHDGPNKQTKVDYTAYKQREEKVEEPTPEPDPELLDNPSGSRVIPPEELGENEDYEIVTLMYYDDGVLTDDMDEVIDDIEDLIGYESLNHFGEYEKDSVCLVNDDREKYYEILLDHRKLADVYAQRQVFLDKRNEAIDEEYGSDD